MKKIFLFALLFLMTSHQSLSQVADHLVIAEIYGGGGEQGSFWTNDYLILYNPTSTPIDLSNWSIQYSHFNGWTWEVTNLSGSLDAGYYYAIQESGDVRGIAPLPFPPNAIGTINFDKNKGKIALVNTQTALTISNPVGLPNVIDFIGYGNGTNAYEGSGPAKQLGLASSLRRKDNLGNNTYGTNGNGWDTDDNFGDTYIEVDLIVNPPLPVELSSFTAKILRSGGVKLDWRTETEVNNYGFEIERSQTSDIKSQMEWGTIGFVSGNGNSNSPKEYSFIDNVLSGKYAYRLKQIDTDGHSEFSKIIELYIDIPTDYELSQNYPNPFNPTTTIRFTLPEPGIVKLMVYNIIGEQIIELVNGFKEAGVHTLTFDASQLNSGVYIYKIETADFTQTRKMIFQK